MVMLYQIKVGFTGTVKNLLKTVLSDKNDVDEGTYDTVFSTLIHFHLKFFVHIVTPQL